MVDALVPGAVALVDADDLWEAFDRIERLASSAKTLLAVRVEASEEWKRAGARSAAEHLAKLSGTSTTEARRMLETSRRVADLPVVAGALQRGELSKAQVDVIAGAAAADPGAQARLVVVAGTTNLTELREECLRMRAAADPDPDATHARIHARRAVRGFTDAEGARHLAVRGPAEQVAVVEAELEPIIDELFARGRAEGRGESREAYAFDALILFAQRDRVTAETARAAKPRYLALVRVDLEALLRGGVEGDETCEIAGVGPIPVRTARDVLGDSILKLVITKGVDVVNVVHLGRGATAAQRVALLWSSPKCANVECSSRFVQVDHRIPWARTKHTVLGELDPLCPHHHRLKTNDGWSLVTGKGRRTFVGPDDPRHPRNRSPP